MAVGAVIRGMGIPAVGGNAVAVEANIVDGGKGDVKHALLLGGINRDRAGNLVSGDRHGGIAGGVDDRGGVAEDCDAIAAADQRPGHGTIVGSGFSPAIGGKIGGRVVDLRHGFLDFGFRHGQRGIPGLRPGDHRQLLGADQLEITYGSDQQNDA